MKVNVNRSSQSRVTVCGNRDVGYEFDFFGNQVECLQMAQLAYIAIARSIIPQMPDKDIALMFSETYPEGVMS